MFSNTGFWKSINWTHQLPEKLHMDSLEPTLPAVCDQRRGNVHAQINVGSRSCFFFFLIVHDEMSWNCVKATVQHLSAHYLAFVSSVSLAMHVDTVAVWGSEKVSGTVWRPARHCTLYKPEVDCRETTRYDCGNFSSSPACMCVSVSVCLEKIWLKI